MSNIINIDLLPLGKDETRSVPPLFFYLHQLLTSSPISQLLKCWWNFANYCTLVNGWRLPWGLDPGKTVWKSFFSILGNDLMYSMASSLVILLRVSLVGVPQMVRTLVIWSISIIWHTIYNTCYRSTEDSRSSPGKRGRPVRSSAMMQPTDQMSTVWL